MKIGIFLLKLVGFVIASLITALIVNLIVWVFRPEPALYKETFQTVYAIVLFLGLLKWFFKKSD